jgi:hypothetical protein
LNKENDIFYNLKEHSVAPPPELLALILEKINKEKDQELKRLFAGLAQHEVTAPSFTLPGKSVDKLAAPANVLPFSWPKKIFKYAAAAVILALLAVSFIYFNRSSQDGLAIVPVHDKETPHAATAADTVTAHNLPHQPDAHPSRKKSIKSDDYFYTNDVNVGTVTFSRVDDNLLTTFASFSYQTVPEFLLKESTEDVLIRVDMYTSINISKEMRSMMKKMYETRRNGKSTRKAKKQKRKLAGWQKADTKYFDAKLDKNPVDVLDLADFLFQ